LTSFGKRFAVILVVALSYPVSASRQIISENLKSFS
jgi:hypothetical protein